MSITRKPEKPRDTENILNLMTVIHLGKQDLMQLIQLLDYLEDEHLERIQQASTVLLQERDMNK